MNTVFQAADNKWYFWDETDTHDYGPYDTMEQAMAALVLYCKQLSES